MPYLLLKRVINVQRGNPRHGINGPSALSKRCKMGAWFKRLFKRSPPGFGFRASSPFALLAWCLCRCSGVSAQQLRCPAGRGVRGTPPRFTVCAIAQVALFASSVSYRLLRLPPSPGSRLPHRADDWRPAWRNAPTAVRKQCRQSCSRLTVNL